MNIKKRRPFSVLLIVLIGAVWAGLSIAEMQNRTETLIKPIIGLNQNWSYFPSLENKTMLRNIQQLSPQMLRYPGGTVTHSWDWKAGVITTRKSKVVHPISDLKILTDATGAKIMFVLDIVNRSIEDQIGMFQAAEKVGVPIEYVEFGNELYAQDKGYQNKFPTGADYATTINSWIPKIRSVYPRAKFAALLLARAVQPSNKRMYEWNTQVIRATQDTVDAYTYHIYIGENGGTVESTMANFISVVKRDNLGSKEIWITEYGNQHDKNLPNYLNELGKLADFIETFPNVTIALNHQIVGEDKNKLTSDGNEFTPEGKMFLQRAAARKR